MARSAKMRRPEHWTGGSGLEDFGIPGLAPPRPAPPPPPSPPPPPVSLSVGSIASSADSDSDDGAVLSSLRKRGRGVGSGGRAPRAQTTATTKKRKQQQLGIGAFLVPAAEAGRREGPKAGSGGGAASGRGPDQRPPLRVLNHNPGGGGGAGGPAAMASDSADRHQAGEGAEGGGASAADPTGAGVEDDIEEGEEGEGKGSSPAPTAAFRRFGLLPACISASRLRSAGTGAAAGETSGDGGGSALGEEDARRPSDADGAAAAPGAGGHLLSELFRRSSIPAGSGGRVRRGGGRGGPTGLLRRCGNSARMWGESDSVGLYLGMGLGIEAMEFDRQGVLLASADSGGFIRIYDFDEVTAADIVVRRRRCRGGCGGGGGGGGDLPFADHPVGERAAVQPVMLFRAGARAASAVSLVRWNPHDQDQLAVCFLTDSRVLIYDLGTETESQPPKFVGLSVVDSQRPSFRGEGTTSLVFLAPVNRRLSCVATGGSYGTLNLWHVPGTGRKKNRGGTLIWSICPFSASPSSQGEGISELSLLEQGHNASKGALLLVGGSMGSLALIDTSKCTRKAFSAKVTPTILWSMNIARQMVKKRLVRGARMPSIGWLGVKRASVWGQSKSTEVHSELVRPGISIPLFPNEARIVVTTNCGWLVDISLRGLANPNPPTNGLSASIQIIHQTVPMKVLNSNLEEVIVGENSKTFSLPECSTPSCVTPGHSSFLWIAQVKRVCKVMPDKDNRVLSSHGHIRMEAVTTHDDDAILLLDVDQYAEVENSHLSGDVVAQVSVGKGSPQCIATHPSSQWIVVGFGKNRKDFMLLSNRNMDMLAT